MSLPPEVQSPRKPRTIVGISAVAGGIALALHPTTPAAAATLERTSDTRAHDVRPAQGPDPQHTVAPGDTVSAIASAYALATADVLAWNGLTPASVIYPGDVIRLTPPAAAALPAAAPAAAPAQRTHTVAAGDTISGIAGRAGVSVEAILAANALTWDSIIYPGQAIAIPSPAAQTAAAPAAAPDLELDPEQAENASAIIRIGREMGISDRGIAIALGTAMQESWLRNLDWGDRDSLGLFQQRPSTGWGTAEQVRDIDRSIRAFFGGANDPNGSATRGLLDIPGWESMTFADAAQAVQISEFPDRYANWEAPATRWLSVLG